MTYCCDDCGFLFSRRGEIFQGPSCESGRIRAATAGEAEKLQELLRQTARSEKAV